MEIGCGGKRDVKDWIKENLVRAGLIAWAVSVFGLIEAFSMHMAGR